MTSNETPSNIELQSTGTAALERSAAVESTLGVSVHEGVVTLSGSVKNAAERTAARGHRPAGARGQRRQRRNHPRIPKDPTNHTLITQHQAPAIDGRFQVGWSEMNPVSIDRFERRRLALNAVEPRRIGGLRHRRRQGVFRISSLAGKSSHITNLEWE
jgi:hypothetical protein